MNENLNLTKILEGCEGIKIHSSVFGTLIIDEVNKKGSQIRCKTKGGIYEYFATDGTYSDYGSRGGECVIFPSKDQRDWDKFVRPIKEGTPIMCCEDIDDFKTDYWVFRKYTEVEETAGWLYIIPFDKFNPNDIEGSLKYNIQK